MAFPGMGTASNAFGAARRIARTLTKEPRNPTARDLTANQFGTGSTRTNSTMQGYIAGPTPATPNDVSPASAALKIATAFSTGIKNRDIAAQNAQVAADVQAKADATAALATQKATLEVGKLNREAAPGYDQQHSYDVAAGTNRAATDFPKPDTSAGSEMVPIPPTAVADLNKYLQAGLDPSTTEMKKSALDAYGKSLGDNLDFLAEKKKRGVAAGGSPVTLSPEATDFWARWAATSGQLPSLGMGASGAPARMSILNRAPEVAGGTDVAGNKAAYRADSGSLQALTKQSDAIKAFEGTATANVGTLRQTMKHLQDTGSPILNMPLREAARQFAGDPNVAAFNAALQIVNNEYARINTNPNLVGELSDAARREFRHSLDPNLTVAGLEQVLEVLALDARNRRSQTDATLRDTRERIRTALPATPAHPLDQFVR